MSAVAIPLRPWSLRAPLWAVVIHAAFGLFLLAVHVYKSAIPEERQLSPIEVVVMGDVDLEAMQRKSRARTSIKMADLKQGVVIGKAASGEGLPFGKLLGQAAKMGTGSENMVRNAPGGAKPRSDGRAFALLAKNLRQDLVDQAGQHRNDAAFKVIDRLPEKVRGVEWKALPPPELKTDAALSAQDIERLRAVFSAKWVEIRDCYEQALLHDEKLAGYVNLQVSVSGGGVPGRVTVDWRGDGNGASQQALKRCVSGTAEAMRFVPKLQGQTLQVGYRLRS